jgi:hypothetical protein
MFLSRVHLVLIGAWFSVLAIAVGASIALNTPPTPTQLLGVALMAFLPAVVMVGVFRGTPPPTIGEVLYQTEHTTNITRERLLNETHPARRGPGRS